MRAKRDVILLEQKIRLRILRRGYGQDMKTALILLVLFLLISMIFVVKLVPVYLKNIFANNIINVVQNYLNKYNMTNVFNTSTLIREMVMDAKFKEFLKEYGLETIEEVIAWIENISLINNTKYSITFHVKLTPTLYVRMKALADKNLSKLSLPYNSIFTLLSSIKILNEILTKYMEEVENFLKEYRNIKSIVYSDKVASTLKSMNIDSKILIDYIDYSINNNKTILGGLFDASIGDFIGYVLNIQLVRLRNANGTVIVVPDYVYDEELKTNNILSQLQCIDRLVIEIVFNMTGEGNVTPNVLDINIVRLPCTNNYINSMEQLGKSS